MLTRVLIAACLVHGGTAGVSTLHRSDGELSRRGGNAPSFMAARAAAAGGAAGMLTNGLLHPLDTAKVLRQKNPGQFASTFGCLVTTARERGVRALYGGVGPAAFGAFPSSALYFGTYEFVKRQLGGFSRQFDGSEGRRPFVHLVAAICGNTASSLLFVPKEFVKQQLQVATAGSNEARKTAISVIRTTVQTKGVGGLYTGIGATLLRNIPSAAIRFVSYEEIKLLLRKDGSMGPEAYVLAGAFSGMLASGLTTPMDVVKTKLATGVLSRDLSLLQCLKRVAQTEGLVGMYTGIQGRLVWSALFSAVGFSAFEWSKTALHLPEEPISK